MKNLSFKKTNSFPHKLLLHTFTGEYFIFFIKSNLFIQNSTWKGSSLYIQSHIVQEGRRKEGINRLSYQGYNGHWFMDRTLSNWAINILEDLISKERFKISVAIWNERNKEVYTWCLAHIMRHMSIQYIILQYWAAIQERFLCQIIFSGCGTKSEILNCNVSRFTISLLFCIKKMEFRINCWSFSS